MAITLGFYGGAGTVTGSKILLDADGRRLLIDCGLFQGLKDLRLMNWQAPPFKPASIDAVVLTHTHLDHSGYIPRLVKSGYRGPIFCTSATRELAEILLLDAARLQEEDAEYANRKGFSKHRPALPLFTEQDALAALRQFHAVEHEAWWDPAGFQIRLLNAGHILGSTFADVVAPADSGIEQRIVFSGDIGRFNAPLHADPDPRPECDTLVLESTYGDRLHDPTPLADQIRLPFQRTIARGGTILIPAFAVARAQLITLLLTRLIQAGEIPQVPVHIDSPMAVDVTQTYERYLRSDELDQLPQDGQRHLFPMQVTFHRTVQESKALNDLPGPRIIISASGMLTGGRVLHHMLRLLPEKRNLLVLVGFQAAGTRGRAIQDGASFVRMHGENIPVRAQTISVEGLSAHADRDELLRWLHTCQTAPKSVFLTHGEPQALNALAARIRAERIETLIPSLSGQFALDPATGGWKPTRAM
jgi:metallo-beta-lactamase family protein